MSERYCSVFRAKIARNSRTGNRGVGAAAWSTGGTEAEQSADQNVCELKARQCIAAGVRTVLGREPGRPGPIVRAVGIAKTTQQLLSHDGRHYRFAITCRSTEQEIPARVSSMHSGSPTESDGRAWRKSGWRNYGGRVQIRLGSGVAEVRYPLPLLIRQEPGERHGRSIWSVLWCVSHWRLAPKWPLFGRTATRLSQYSAVYGRDLTQRHHRLFTYVFRSTGWVKKVTRNSS